MHINSQITVNLPNFLTSLRFILTPVFLIFFYIHFSLQKDKVFGVLSISVFLIICLTDILDGYVARKKELSSLFGMYFDVAADFFFRLFSLVLFLFLKIVSFWLVFVYIIFFLEFILLSRIRSLSGRGSKINIFRKITPLLYTVFIGFVVVRENCSGLVPSYITVSFLSFVLVIFTLLAISEGLLSQKRVIFK